MVRAATRAPWQEGHRRAVGIGGKFPAIVRCVGRHQVGFHDKAPFQPRHLDGIHLSHDSAQALAGAGDASCHRNLMVVCEVDQLRWTQAAREANSLWLYQNDMGIYYAIQAMLTRPHTAVAA
jgi:hypothetical protein